MIKKGTTSIAEIKKGTTSIGSVYKGYNLVFASWETLTTQGIPPLTINDMKGGNLLDYKIYGDSVQNGTPTPNNPVEVQSVGDLITDSQDENYGKYKIPITASNGVNSTTVNIYLDKPLRKVGNDADYIDFANQKVIRNVDSLILTGQESWNRLNNNRVYIQISAKKYTTYVLCNCYTNRADTIDLSITGRDNNSTIVFRDNTNTGESGTTTWTTFLANKYANSSPVIIYYSLRNAVQESVTLPNITSFKDTTTYSIGTTIQPSNMWIKYKGK